MPAALRLSAFALLIKSWYVLKVCESEDPNESFFFLKSVVDVEDVIH